MIINKQQLLEELYTDWNELEAYKVLEKEPFCFNGELIYNNSNQNEKSKLEFHQSIIDFYIEDILNNNNLDYKINKKNKLRLNQYKRKQIDKIKLKKLSKYAYTIYYNKERQRYTRFYLSGKKGYAKWCSKKVVRNSGDFCLKGNGYRKVYDYWWTVF